MIVSMMHKQWDRDIFQCEMLARLKFRFDGLVAMHSHLSKLLLGEGRVKSPLGVYATSGSHENGIKKRNKCQMKMIQVYI